MSNNRIGLLLGGHYKIVQEICGGGFGLTYLAEDTQLISLRQCVVKQLRPPNNDPRTVQIARHLFKREAEALERLGHHDQIPRLLAYFEENQEFYLIQEFIPGQILTQEIVQGQPLPEDKVISILTEVLKVLAFVHEQGVIHRDIKPANLIRRQTDGKIVLIDFGAVKQVATQIVDTQGQITSTVAVGTPTYMPIEQFCGQPQFNSDLYALGVIGIQALTGLLAEDISRLRDQKNPNIHAIYWRHRAQVSPKLADIIDKMVCFDCLQRYQSATQVLEDISQTETISGPQKPQKPRRRWLVCAGAVIASIVVGGMSWYTLFRPQLNLCQSYKQGVEAIEKKDYKKAIKDFDQCILSNPTDGLSYLYQGDAYYASKIYPKAIEDYNKALNIFEDQPNLVGVGIRLEKQDDRLIVARVYYGTPALTEGVKIGDQILKIDGRPTKDMSQEQATNVLSAGQLNTPVTLEIAHAGGELTLNRIAIADNIRAKIYINLGLAQSAQGNKTEALNDYKQSLNLNQNNDEAYYEQGRIRSDMKDKQGAIGDFNKAIQFNPNYIEAYLRLGDVLSSQGNKQGSINTYTQAISINSAAAYGDDYLKQLYAEAYYSRGNVKYQLSDKQGAIEDYTKAIQLNSDYDSAYYNRAIVRSNLGDKGAVKDFQIAADLCLKHGNYKCYADIIKSGSLQH
jgi:serine/threonine protein kinase